MNSLHFFSLVTAPVQVLNTAGDVLSKATIFFYKQDEQYIYLLTNWHVVTGRSPLAPMFSKTGAVPTRLRLFLHENVSENAISLSRKFPMDVTINDDTGNAPEWLEHPIHKFNVDVAVIKIPKDNEFTEKAKYNCLANYDFHKDFFPSAMNDVFVVGYPWGLTGGDRVLPLYKRGSVASEPIVPYSNLPRFLIDCRTSEGMSGSPVICRHSGLWAPVGFSARFGYWDS